MSEHYKNDDETFIAAVNSSRNICQTLQKLGLSFRGASYQTFRKRCENLGLDLSHFKPDKETRKLLVDEDVINAVRNAQSRMDCLNRLHLRSDTNMNVSWITKRIFELTLNTSHWLGLGHLAGKTHNWSKKKSTEELLVKGELITTKRKERLVREGVLKDECYKCGISAWHGEKLSLHLDHINGEHLDNRLENLRMLCPNCHSLTPTYCRAKSSFETKPSKKKYDPISKLVINCCLDCDKLICPGAKRCRPCAGKFTYKNAHKCTNCKSVIDAKFTVCATCHNTGRNAKIDWPQDEELIKLYESLPMTTIAKQLGVSDNAIKKRLKKKNLI